MVSFDGVEPVDSKLSVEFEYLSADDASVVLQVF